MKAILRICLGLVAIALLLFLVTGILDYLYVRAIVGAFQQGLGAINWVNPHLGKTIIALVSGIASVIGFRVFAFGFASVRRMFEWVIVTPLFLAAIAHGIATPATWGDIFDSLGHSHLYYGIDDDNRVQYFSRSGAHPQTGEPLLAVTPENVREVELRRHLEPKEIQNPGPDDWFTVGKGKPKLWVVLRDDGYHFFNLPGFDAAIRTERQPVTREIKTDYEAAGRRHEAERLQAEAEQKQKQAVEAELMRKHDEEKLLKQEAEENSRKLERTIARYTSLGDRANTPERTEIAVAINHNAATDLLDQAVQPAFEGLTNNGTAFLIDALHSDELVKDGIFDQLWGGNSNVVSILRFEQRFDYFILAKVSEESLESTVRGDLRSLRCSVSLKLFSTKPLRFVQSFDSVSVSPGFSRNSMLLGTKERLIEDFTKKIHASLPELQKHQP